MVPLAFLLFFGGEVVPLFDTFNWFHKEIMLVIVLRSTKGKDQDTVLYSSQPRNQKRLTFSILSVEAHGSDNSLLLL